MFWFSQLEEGVMHVSRSFRAVGLSLAVLALSIHASEVSAGCTLREEASAVRKSVSRLVRCNDKRFRAGPTAECSLSDPPACAGSLVDDAVALAYGANDPPPASVDTRELRDQLRCQKRVGKGVATYVGTKLRGLIRQDDAAKLEAKARKQLDKIPDKCLVSVAVDAGSQILVPTVGPQCAAAVGNAGDAVDGVPLRDCLHTLLEVWVDRWGPSPQPLRPNIVFVLTDDQRWDTTDATHSGGGPDVMPRTRAELADQGVEFTEAFMTTPLCCPSRSSILSGQYAHRHGVYKNSGTNGGADDFDDISTLATWLETAGYRTSLIGKYLNGYSGLWQAGQPPYVPPGWTDWHGMKNVAFFNYVIVEPDGVGGYVENSYGNAEADYSTDVLREKAKQFITDSVNAGQPFFLYLAFKAPHLPQIPAPRHEGMFEGIAAWRPPSYNEPDVSDKPSWMQTLPLQNSVDLDQVRIDQLEMLQAVDEAIGGSTTYGITGIMQHLRDLGVADRTIVVYFSDNGWLWGEHRLRAKNQPYEESIRSPMMVRYPKLAPLPRKEARFVLNIDLAPTFAELVGAGVPIIQDGASLVTVLDGTQPVGNWRTDVLTEAWPASHPWAGVREQQWKYTEIALSPGDPATQFDRELYDLSSDRYEETNVAADPQHAARVTAMAARLRQLRPNWPIDSDPNGPDPLENE
jgi:N-acetylglucosamine-6-sulfatase